MVQKILVVEDIDRIAQHIRVTLERALGVEVVCVNGNRDALEFLNAHHPSLVITDLGHADGSGVDLVEHIRSVPRLKSIPVIVQSGQLWDAGFDPRLFENRIDGALAKPYTTRTLFRLVTRCLGEQNSEMSADVALVRVGSESRSLDYKQMVDLEDMKARAGLAKDVIAFFNSGGGSIVVGVGEEAPGRFALRGVTNAVAESLEVTRLNDLLRRYIGTELSVSARRVEIEAMTFVIVSVPACTTELAYARGEHPEAGLFPGRVYVRNDAAQTIEVRDAVTLGQLIDRLVHERMRRRAIS
jgi:CheY-like chemotaxis protein